MFRVSRQTDRIVGTLEPGQDFVEGLIDICKKEGMAAGEIRAVGHFDSMELVYFNGKTQKYETLIDADGSFDLVSLTGNVSRLGDEIVLRLDAIVNVLAPLGPQMVGGQLRRARVATAEFVISVFRDLRMERRLDAQSGRLLLDKVDRIVTQSEPAAPTQERAPLSAQKESPKAAAPKSSSSEIASSTSAAEGPSMSWGEAIAEAEDAEKARAARRGGRAMPKRPERDKDPFDAFDEDEPWIAAGDYLDHAKLGRCKVMKVEDDQYVHVRLPRGRIRKLAMTVLDIRFFGEEEGRRIFEARVRR